MKNMSLYPEFFEKREKEAKEKLRLKTGVMSASGGRFHIVYRTSSVLAIPSPGIIVPLTRLICEPFSRMRVGMSRTGTSEDFPEL